jgi:hypothetical protein
MDNTEQTQIPEVVDQAVDTHEKSPKESFSELRKAKDEAERQAWQARKELEMLQSQMQQQKAPIQQEEDYDYRQLEHEQFPDGKNLMKAFNTLNKKLSSYEQKLQEKDHQLQAVNVRVEYPDYLDVVTAENVEKYIKNDEDMREAVEKSANPLRKAYNLIKKSAAYQADKASMKKPSVSQEQKRVDEKESKPKTSSLGVRSEAVTMAAQISNSRMTKEQKNALWAETLAAARK